MVWAYFRWRVYVCRDFFKGTFDCSVVVSKGCPYVQCSQNQTVHFYEYILYILGFGFGQFWREMVSFKIIKYLKLYKHAIISPKPANKRPKIRKNRPLVVYAILGRNKALFQKIRISERQYATVENDSLKNLKIN